MSPRDPGQARWVGPAPLAVDTFLATAELARRLIDAPETRTAWSAPSALEGYDVAGLCGHLARAVLTFDGYLDDPTERVPTTDAAGYFVHVLADHHPVTSEFHATVRRRSDEEAAAGPDALSERMRDARTRLAARLRDTDPSTPIAVRDDLVLRVDDYLETRLVELVLHIDDLAVSVDSDLNEELPAGAAATVAGVLARIAVQRSGALPTLRGLARRERHPGPVRAM